jgi:hypothetical protein
MLRIRELNNYFFKGANVMCKNSVKIKMLYRSFYIDEIQAIRYGKVALLHTCNFD